MSAKLVTMLTVIANVLLAFLADPIGIKKRRLEAERKLRRNRTRQGYDASKVSFEGHLAAGRIAKAETELAQMRDARRLYNELACGNEPIIPSTDCVAFASQISAKRAEMEAAAQAEHERLAREARARAEDETKRAAAEKAERIHGLQDALKDWVKRGQAALTDPFKAPEIRLQLARSSHDAAKAVYEDLKLLTPDTKYGTIKDLEKAIARAQTKLNQELAAAERERLAKAQAVEAQAKRAAAEAERERRETEKRAKAEAEAHQQKGIFDAALQEGHSHLQRKKPNLALAETALVRARAARNAANKVIHGLCPYPPLKGLIDAMDEAKKANEAKKAAQEQRKAAQAAQVSQEMAERRWLKDFFGERRLPAHRRCAVCLAQAKRLISKHGNPPSLLQAYEDLRAFLKHGLDQFGVQLCDVNAAQGWDKPGRDYGHRVFGPRGINVVGAFVDVVTGEIPELDKLEREMEITVSHVDFRDKLGRLQYAAAKRAAPEQRKPAQAKTEAKAAA